MTIVGGLKHSRNKHVFLRLLQAARGQYVPKNQGCHCLLGATTTKSNNSGPATKGTSSIHLYEKKNPLPCFPLHPNHIRAIPKIRSSTTSSSTDHLSPSSPEDFHAYLCESIRHAKRRVKLATLYIGAGNGCMSTPSSIHSGGKSPREEELLNTLRGLSKNDSVEIKILMDMSRALRPIRIVPHTKKGQDSNASNTAACTAATTSSAKEVFYSLFPDGVRNHTSKTNDKGLSLFNVHRNGFASSLPSPLNEILGVFHLKIYIIDDELILSGANLSEEYFTDRLDRYISFVDGANGLVDFYSDLVDILMRYSAEYDPSTSNSDLKIDQDNSKQSNDLLSKELSNLFNGVNSYDDENQENYKEIFAYAVPTFQPPKNFFQHNPVSFPKDIDVVRNLLFTALELNPNSSIYMSSAYLNLTPSLMAAIEKFGKRINDDSPSSTHERGVSGAAFLLTASPSTHGFKPKKKNDAVNGSGRSWIPFIYYKLAQDMYSKIRLNGGKMLLYDRDGHTFHAKGIWLASASSVSGGNCGIDKLKGPCSSDSNVTESDWRICEPAQNLIATVVGSSNFGSRSEKLDIESNCIIVMNPSIDSDEALIVKKAIANEWNGMLDYCIDLERSGIHLKKRQNASKNIGDFMADFMQSLAKKIFWGVF